MMTEEEKQELHIIICKDIECGTYLLTPEYVNNLIKKKSENLKRENDDLKSYITSNIIHNSQNFIRSLEK